jgi:hypothetical protein
MRPCPQCANPCDTIHKFCPACGFPVGKVATNSDDPLLGRSLPGGYVILELVGVGGMGRVYRAEQTTLGRTVAVKIIHPHLVGEENAAARFITEARAASRLNHPNSVAIIDFGKTSDGQLYLVMEFLRGKDLARVAYEEGPLAFRRIIDILRQVLAALGEAHELGIIHRDLKPENVIVEPTRAGGDFVKVVDFGLAKMKVEKTQPSITSPGIVCGTPEYMSPEQGRGDPLDARSDLYSVGVVLFLLLTGRLPFEADSPTQVVLCHLTQPPPDPRGIAPERKIPDTLVAVLMKAMEKEASKRYRDADDFASALAGALAEIEDRGAGRSMAVVAGVRCLGCGEINGVGQKFCGACGLTTTSTNLTTLPLLEEDRASALPPIAARKAAKVAETQPAPDRSAAATEAPPGRADRSKRKLPLPLIAREADLTWLIERRAKASAALAGARIVGEPGIGKTRLLREFITSAAAAGGVVVETEPDPAWAEVGYYALRRSILLLAGLPESGGETREWTAASAEARRGLADVFGHELSHPGVDTLSPEERRFAAAEALRWALVRANTRADGKGVVLAIDDLQKCDGASRNAFADAISEPPLVPALVVATYAPGFDPGWSSQAAAARVLQGLPTADVAALLGAQQSASSAQLKTGGFILPLYVEQLMRFTTEQGGGAPARLVDIMSLRVERMPADARRVLQAISVWGDDTTDGDLLKLVSADDIDLVEALGFLRRAGMMEVTANGYRTAHPLLREVVLATIPNAVRRELHATAGALCEEENAPIEMRALHSYYAGDAFEALILLERVSVDCTARGDQMGSVMALRRGLELARRELFRGELDDPMRAVLIFSRKLGEALARGGSFTDADGVLREALDMAGPSGQERARVLGALAHVAHGRDRTKEATSYLREALELASRDGSRDLVSSLETLKRALAS